VIGAARKLLSLYGPDEYWRLAGLAVSMAVTGVLQTIGIASIVPFLAVVSNPAVITENRYFAWGYETFGFTNTTDFLLALGGLFIAITIISNAFAAFTAWLTIRLRWRSYHRISQRLLEQYLAAPYAFHLTQNSAGIFKVLFGHVGRAIGEVFVPMCRIFSRVVSSVFIIALLVWADPLLAALVPLTIGGIYALTYLMVQRQQRQAGLEEARSVTERYQTASEALGGIKDIKVLGRELFFLDRFRRSAKHYGDAHARAEAVSQLPRFGLDAVAYSGVIAVVLYLLQTRQSLDEIFPLIAIYALGANRLIPGVQEVFTSMAQIRFSSPALDEICADAQLLAGWRVDRLRGDNGGTPRIADGLVPSRNIRIENLSFSYEGSPRPALDGITLDIPVRRTSAFVGQTGSGKTTLADIVLGLFEPTEGRVLIDDTVLDKTVMPKWRRSVGYVPQTIFLADTSIARNIAFGIADERLDLNAVHAAARAAHLDEFVASLPEGYDTFVGERGVRLSGGQRQRIGIARALYHNPEVLVFDEATSALDTVTEEIVMRAIGELAGSRTIILIAHRLSTVRSCDMIFVLDAGHLVGQGRYDELVASNAAFRAMASA
jgi:ABC-type multidrug transport system fused ATPase/permease subunit